MIDRFSKIKLFNLITISFILGVASYYSLQSELWLLNLNGILTSLLLVCYILMQIRFVFLPKPIVTINESGLIDHRVLNAPIPLNQIEMAQLKPKSLQLHLKSSAQIELKAFYKIIARKSLQANRLNIDISLLSSAQTKLLLSQLSS